MMKLRRWGPWAWSADGPQAPTAPSFVQQAVLGLLLSKLWGTACPMPAWRGLWASLDPFEPESVL